MRSTISQAIAILKLPRHVAGVIHFGKSVVTSMTNNPHFSAPSPPLATLSAHLEALDAAEAAVLSRTKGTAEARDANRVTVTQDLGQLRAYVQSVADADPSEARAIIEGAGMNVKKVGSRGKSGLAVTQGPVSGDAHLVAKAPSRRAAYDWQYGLDGVTWISVPSTLGATTDIRGLVPGTRHAFRFRALTKAGESDWSQVVWLLAA